MMELIDCRFNSALARPRRSRLARWRAPPCDSPSTRRRCVRTMRCDIDSTGRRDGKTPTSTRARRRPGRARLTFFCNVCRRGAQSEDTLNKVRSIISEQLGTDLDAIAADAKFVDLGADSLDTVEIMMALEEQFEITLDEEGAEKIATVQEAADMIQEQI